MPDSLAATLIPEVMPRDADVRAIAARSPFSLERFIKIVPAGASVAEIIRAFNLTPEVNARVFLNEEIVLLEERTTTITRAGDTVTIRVIPQPMAIPLIAIAVAQAAAASAATAAVAGGISASIGAAIGVSAATVSSVIGAIAGGAIGLVGKLLMTALVPPPTPSGPQFTTNPAKFTISGQVNSLSPFACVPKVYGTRLIYPQQAATPYNETVANLQYLRQLFVLGYGPLEISQIRLQDALIANFENVEWEMRAGYPDDAPPTLFTGTVVQDNLNVLLAQAPGNVVTLEGWQQQTSGTDADELSVDITWPGGLMSIGNGNGAHNPCQISIQVRYAPTGTTSWITRPTMVVTAATSSQVLRSETWQVPAGQYDVQVQALHVVPYKGNFSNALVIDCYWTALRTIRDRSAFSMSGLALLAVRIRATHQLNGPIANLNVLASSILPDWDGTSWTDRAGSWTYDYDNQGAGASAYGLDGATPHTSAARTGSNWIVDELLATGNGSSTTYAGTLAEGPVQPASFYGSTGVVPFLDDGLGNIHPDGSLIPTWQAFVTYQPGAVVRYGSVYMCIRTASGGTEKPTNATYWVLAITAGTIDYSTRAVSITFGNALAAPNAAQILVSYIQQLFTAGGGKALTIKTASGSDGASVACKVIPVHQDPQDQESGETLAAIQYTVSGWYKASSAISAGIRLRVMFSSDENFSVSDPNNIAGSSVDVIANGSATTAWQQASATVTAPQPPPTLARDSSYFLRVICYHNPDGVGGVTVGWDNIVCIRANGSAQRANFIPNPSFDFPGVMTSNPAAHVLDVLQGPANKMPLPAARIDMTGLQAWRVWNAANNRSNNNIVDSQTTVFEALRAIAAMGRASFAMKDGLYSVLQDLPQTTPIQHLSPRNSWDFKSTRAFPILPGMLKVRFINPGANYQSDERWVYDDGFTASTPNLITEVLDLTHGCTDPNQAWRDGRYHLAQARLRPEIYELTVDFENLVCTRGDLVLVSHDVIEAGLGFGRVKEVQLDGGGNCVSITCDENFTFNFGSAYVIRIRRSDGTSLLLNLVNSAPSGGSFTNDTLVFQTALASGNPFPEISDLAMFGLSGSETLQMIVTKIMPGKDLTATLQLQDYSPAIYSADSGTPPPFNYGQSQNLLAATASSTLPTAVPPAPASIPPTIIAAASGDTALTQSADGSRDLLIQISLQPPVNPTTGVPYPASSISAIEVQHRRTLLDSSTNNAAAWNNSTAYIIGDTITDSNGVVWRCCEANTNEAPGTFDGSGNPYWTILTQDEPWNVSVQPYNAQVGRVTAAPVEAGFSYDVRVRFQLADGNVSQFTTLVGHTVAGQVMVPADITGLAVTLLTLLGVRLTWTASSSPNVREYEIRSGSSWAGGTMLARVRTTRWESHDIPLGAITFWVGTIDTSGNYGAAPVSVSTTIVSGQGSVSLTAISVGTFSLDGVPDGSGRVLPQGTEYASPGSYNYTVPAGVSFVLAYIYGAGGGGGGYGSTYHGGGGGSGAAAIAMFAVTAGDVLTIFVGLGGAAGANTPTVTDGSDGTNSYIIDGSRSWVAEPGLGGKKGSTSNGAAGLGGVLSARDYMSVAAGAPGTAGGPGATDSAGGVAAGGSGGFGGNYNGSAANATAGENGLVVIIPLS